MAGLSWVSIVRLGLMQTALGAMFVLTANILNRVMVVDLKMAAIVPGALLAIHHAVQAARPKWGHSSDSGNRRTPWILGGLVVLGAGVILATVATAWISDVGVAWGVFAFWKCMAFAVVAYVLIGIGVGAAGTSLLGLMAAKVARERRGPAAIVTFLMMIFGFILTSAFARRFLDEFSMERLINFTVVVVLIALGVAFMASWGVERSVIDFDDGSREDKTPFGEAFRQVWADPRARAFTVFVSLSMIAYGTQELILEPFAGLVYRMSVGETSGLGGTQNSGVFLGMILVSLAVGGRHGPRLGSVRLWTIVGCAASAAILGLLTLASFTTTWPLKSTVMALGLANGVYAGAAIAWMMILAGEGHASREGVRMGLWGAAQAIGMALGGFLGTVGVTLFGVMLGLGAAEWTWNLKAMAQAMAEGPSASPIPFAAVFAIEGAVFALSAVLAARMSAPVASRVAAESPQPSTVPVLNAAELTS